jgi:methylthioribose-1-phosphate isomerase
MRENTANLRPIWTDPGEGTVKVIDQRKLPHAFKVMDLETVDAVIYAIREMVVRGAPLIGVTGAYGVYIATANGGDRAKDDAWLAGVADRITAARPTAVNLAWAVNRTLAAVLSEKSVQNRINRAWREAGDITEEEAENSRRIGRHGLSLIMAAAEKKSGGPVNILTHCNAGALACVELGTATAPIYAAHDHGIPVHVWVDETRPLNQGSRLTAWELGRHGVPHTVITDNAGGHLMQHNMVDMVIVGTDRTTYTGDVANKIGTYLKALSARDNHVPFYVALPSSTFDWTISDGLTGIPIEARDPDEVRFAPSKPRIPDHLLVPENSPAANFAFDVTPARLVTAFITERGICQATETDIRRLFPDKRYLP